MDAQSLDENLPFLLTQMNAWMKILLGDQILLLLDMANNILLNKSNIIKLILINKRCTYIIQTACWVGGYWAEKSYVSSFH